MTALCVRESVAATSLKIAFPNLMAHRVAPACPAFKLDRDVADVEIAPEDGVDLLKQKSGFVQPHIVDLDVGAHVIKAGRDGPDVDVVNEPHPLNPS